MGICAGKPATKTSEDPNSQVEPVENGYQVNFCLLFIFMFSTSNIIKFVMPIIIIVFNFTFKLSNTYLKLSEPWQVSNLSIMK